MAVFVKICGLTTASAVEAAVAAGASALGFVFAESPRCVSPADAARLCAGVPPTVRKVAVMKHPSAADWQAVTRDFSADWLQTDAEDFSLLELPISMGRLPVHRDTPALREQDLEPGDLILFEAGDSGTGTRADWGRAARLARRQRVVLAGGLHPDNVAEAIRIVRPFGVDVSSGVESSRGVKDIGRIAAFVAAARAAEQSDAG